jgi:hypothetical protein
MLAVHQGQKNIVTVCRILVAYGPTLDFSSWRVSVTARLGFGYTRKNSCYNPVDQGVGTVNVAIAIV